MGQHILVPRVFPGHTQRVWPGSIFVDHTLLRTKSAGFITLCSILTFRGCAPFVYPPLPTKITFIGLYNTMLNFIPVSFCTAYIFVTVRVKARVRVRLGFRVRV